MPLSKAENSCHRHRTPRNPAAVIWVKSLTACLKGLGHCRNRHQEVQSFLAFAPALSKYRPRSVFTKARCRSLVLLVAGLVPAAWGQSADAFNPGASNSVDVMAIQANGQVLAGGWFTSLGGQAVNYLGRLNASGTLDSTFNAGAD